MKTKGFTLIEMIIAMSLMGLVLVGGGKLYSHLNGMLFTYQSQQEYSLLHLQGQRIFQQDLLESISIQELTDSSVCLRKYVFEEPICYVRQDSFWVRKRAKGKDTLNGGERMMEMIWLMYGNDLP